MRSLRRTMVGGLDAEAPEGESPASNSLSGAGQSNLQATNSTKKVRKRDVKQTIIGGLEAAAGSAPGAVQSGGRALPGQDTPPGTWIATLADGRTLKLTESDLPRALDKGYVNAETLVWRVGMHDWHPLGQIPELDPLLNRKSAVRRPVSPQASRTERPVPHASEAKTLSWRVYPVERPACTRLALGVRKYQARPILPRQPVENPLC